MTKDPFQPPPPSLASPPGPGLSLRQRRREQRVRQLLEAALAVFAEKGYLSASMEEVAERSLITRAGLYKYFPDKLALLRALRGLKLGELASEVGSALSGGGSFRARVRTAIQATLAYQARNEPFFTVFFNSGVSPESIGDAALAPYLALLSRLIEEAVAAGEVEPLPPFELAGFLAAMLFKPSIARSYLVDRLDPPAAPLADLVERVFLRGVLASPPGQARPEEPC